MRIEGDQGRFWSTAECEASFEGYDLDEWTIYWTRKQGGSVKLPGDP